VLIVPALFNNRIGAQVTIHRFSYPPNIKYKKVCSGTFRHVMTLSADYIQLTSYTYSTNFQLHNFKDTKQGKHNILKSRNLIKVEPTFKHSWYSHLPCLKFGLNFDIIHWLQCKTYFTIFSWNEQEESFNRHISDTKHVSWLLGVPCESPQQDTLSHQH
jgi:hypothetical protein